MDDPVDKDFVDRAIAAERRWITSEFKSRDDALKLLADGVRGQKAVYLAIGLAVLAILGELVLKFVVK